MNRIAIIGCGGVGGYFGGKLCQLRHEDPELHLTMVARGEHLEAIRANGLTLNTEKEGSFTCQPSRATDDLESLDEQDVILLCVKEFDLAETIKRMKTAIGQDTVVLPLLNGVDVYDRIRQIQKSGKVFPACVYVGTHIESPGVVTQKGGACKILLGPDPQSPDFIPQELLDKLTEAKVRFEWSPDVQSSIWEKFTFICSFGLITAAYDKVLGEVTETPELRQRVEEIMAEIVGVASALKVDLPSDITQVALAKADGFPYETKTSFQRDFERSDKRDERELFAGAMLKYGETLGIQLPRIAEMRHQIDQKKPQ